MPSFDNDNRNAYKSNHIDSGIITPAKFGCFLLYAFIPVATLIHIIILIQDKEIKKAILWAIWMIAFWVSLILLVTESYAM